MCFPFRYIDTGDGNGWNGDGMEAVDSAHHPLMASHQLAGGGGLDGWLAIQCSLLMRVLPVPASHRQHDPVG
eukprot:364730-Chlamydomonas_euryale.AAC.3